jgi:hypothetical protein
MRGGLGWQRGGTNAAGLGGVAVGGGGFLGRHDGGVDVDEGSGCDEWKMLRLGCVALIARVEKWWRVVERRRLRDRGR